MEAITIILTFVLAYGVFMVLAYVLARVFFPVIDVDDYDPKPKRLRKSKRIASRVLR